MKNNKKLSGFTLVEIMVALIVFAFFLSISIPVLNKKISKDQAENEKLMKYDCEAISSNCMACKEKICLACSNSCGNSFYLNVEDCSCKSCPENCDGCSKDACTHCLDGYTLSDENKCVENSASNIKSKEVGALGLKNNYINGKKTQTSFLKETNSRNNYSKEDAIEQQNILNEASNLTNNISQIKEKLRQNQIPESEVDIDEKEINELIKDFSKMLNSD